MSAERNGPYGPQHIALQKMRLDNWHGDRRHAPAALMEAIDVESVCQACAQILAAGSGRREEDQEAGRQGDKEMRKKD
jgi:hypothetical protein